MSSLKNITLGLVCLIFISIGCRINQQEIPKAIQEFPIDTTISIIANLANEVDESSGIILWNNTLWTHNDSKKDAALFEINMDDGSTVRKIDIADLNNKDWEELTQDETYIYIGDFGNNHGNRKDLRIFKVLKEEIEQTGKVTKVDTIAFVYPDQTDFSGPTHDHNYDCEAMISVGDSLYLFSKNFRDKQSRLYSLPKTKGHHTAVLKDRFDVIGNITGADINEEDGVVALSGYYYDNGDFLPFVWLFWEYPNLSFFKGKHQRVNFDFQSQIEGIAYLKDGQFLISSEAVMLKHGQLFYFNPMRFIR